MYGVWYIRVCHVDIRGRLLVQEKERAIADRKQF